MALSQQDHYRIDGVGFVVTVTGDQIPVGSIVQAVMDATLSTGDSITVTRLPVPA